MKYNLLAYGSICFLASLVVSTFDTELWLWQRWAILGCLLAARVSGYLSSVE